MSWNGETIQLKESVVRQLHANYLESKGIVKLSHPAHPEVEQKPRQSSSAPRPSVNSNAGSKDTNREYEVGGDMNVNDGDDKQNWSFLFSLSIMTRVIYICSFTVSGRPFGMLKQYFV